MKEEKVLVVTAKEVSKVLNNAEGLVCVDENTIMNLIRKGFFVERSKAEINEEWRQIIPYVVMVDRGKVLLMKRTKKQSEKRLHNLYSIGVGGHINDEDSNNPVEAFKKGMKREINEEVDARVRELKFLGVINDLSSPVSRVHLGVLYLAEASFKEMKEKELFEWELVEINKLHEYREGMEGWSKIALDGLKKHLMQS
ncbi:MAG: NUDIX domain-containing protein [Thermotogaceae bacterium]|nr:NUDIX domain-containing protein [Thermotogaceae bacterium]